MGHPIGMSGARITLHAAWNCRGVARLRWLRRPVPGAGARALTADTATRLYTVPGGRRVGKNGGHDTSRSVLYWPVTWFAGRGWPWGRFPGISPAPRSASRLGSDLPHMGDGICGPGVSPSAAVICGRGDCPARVALVRNRAGRVRNELCWRDVPDPISPALAGAVDLPGLKQRPARPGSDATAAAGTGSR